ncbi:MAG: HIT domain-containing protein, partial [Planctomycetota bacterium]
RALPESSAYNVLQNNGAEAGQEVMHVHFHVIPKTAWGGLQKSWIPGAIDHEKAAELAERMRGLIA